MTVRFPFLFFALQLGAWAQPDVTALMPWPASLQWAGGALPITRSFHVTIEGEADPSVRKAADRLLTRLKKVTGIEFSASDGARNSSLTIRCSGAIPKPQKPGDDESYSLGISSSGATLTAASPLGVFRGIETFLQVVTKQGDGWAAPAFSVADRPRFAWRGFMLDVSRHFMPAETVMRQIDAMAAVKLNVFHWHLSDDQGFRMESKVYPRLHTVGADGHYYTQEQIRQVVQYAADRGIRVVPEVDVPGHTSGILAAYPSLASGPGPIAIARTWNIIHAVLNPASDEVYTFLERLFGEMATLFPDPYFHIGGDEVNTRQWSSNPEIKKFMQAQGFDSRKDLHAYMNRRVEKILAKLGKTMIGWDETLHPDLPATTVVQSWRGAGSLAEAARDGHQAILSAGYYLDHMKPAAYHYEKDPMSGEAASLPPDAAKRILGGEACMWVEYVSSENVDMRVWPRLAAIAERLWSPQGTQDLPSMYARLDRVSDLLSTLGLQHQTSREKMLRRLAGNQSPQPLVVLDDALEPVKMYARSTSRSYTTLVPLNRLVDATPPESRVARQFADEVKKALAGDENAAREARARLTAWRDNHKSVLPTLQSSSLLKEIIPLAGYVHDVSVAGVEAMDFLRQHATPPEDWLGRQRKLLGSLGKRVAPAGNQASCVATLTQYGRRRAKVRRQCAEPRYVEELVPVIAEPVRDLVEATAHSASASLR